MQHDYGRMMGWGEISVGENVHLFRATEGYTWEYKTMLRYDVSANEQAFFVSEGMFTRVEIPLNAPAGSKLIVRIHPHPKRESASSCFRQRVHPEIRPEGLRTLYHRALAAE